MKKRTMKKGVLSFLLSTMSVCMLSACTASNAKNDTTASVDMTLETEVSNESESSKIHRVGVCMPDNKVPFFSRMQEGMENASKDLGLEFVFVDADNDTNTQMGQVSTFITQDVDMIIILATQLDALVPSAKEVNEANIPLMTVNRRLCSGTFEEAGVDCITYVGADDYEAGQKQAQLLVDLLGDSGNVVLLQSNLGASMQILRQQGLEDYLAQNAPGIKIVDYQTSNQDQAVAMTVTENWLTRYAPGEIDAIVCQDPYPAIGVADVVTSFNRDELLGKIIAYDYPQVVLDYIKEGKLCGTVIQSPYEQGILAAETVAKYFTEGDTNIEENTYMDLPYVSVDTIEQYPDPAW